MEQELAPSIAALALPSAIILLLLPPLLILGGVCGRRQYSNTSDEVLARHFSLESTSDEGIKVKVEISDVENSGQFSRKASESGSDSSDSLENRFQGPESQDVLYGVARTTNASGNGIGSDSGNSAYSNRFVAVTATQVRMLPAVALANTPLFGRKLTLCSERTTIKCRECRNAL